MGVSDPLFQAIFANVAAVNDRLNPVIARPNFMGGIDIRDRGGDVSASFRPDAAGGMIGTDGVGETVAHISTNVSGGTRIDMGHDEVLNGYPNIFGGENFSSMEGAVGFTKPNFEGGMDLFSPSGEMMLSSSPGLLGTEFSAPIQPDFPFDFASSLDYQEGLDKAEAVSMLLDTSDVADALEITDGIDGLASLFDLF